MSQSGARTLMGLFRRDPETYVLIGVLGGIMGIAGYHLGSKGAESAVPSEHVTMPRKGALPWQSESGSENKVDTFKYRYHPGGDTSTEPREAPSALNTVVVPVRLSSDLYSRWNNGGWGRQVAAEEDDAAEDEDGGDAAESGDADDAAASPSEDAPAAASTEEPAGGDDEE